MKDLVKFIKESLLDMDDSNFITTSQLLEISLMELVKSLLQHTKKLHSTGNSITLIFDNKYDLNKYNGIIKSVRSDLDPIDIKYTYESGIEEQGSLKYYYNDIEFKINGFEVAMDFTYSYKKYIDLGNQSNKILITQLILQFVTVVLVSTAPLVQGRLKQIKFKKVDSYE
jgi:hypothetical protein